MTHPTCHVIAINGTLPAVAAGQSFESEYALGEQLGAMAAADATLGGDVLVRMAREQNETPSISCLRVRAGEVGNYEARRTREARDQLVAALADPANTGPEFAELRYKLHDLVLDQLADPGERADYLIATTRSEVEAVRARLYERLSKLALPSARERLVEAFVTETPEICERVGALLWRQDEAVELLVREHLAAPSPPALVRRIIVLLREEHINVPRAWLINADPSVVTKLGSLVTD